MAIRAGCDPVWPTLDSLWPGSAVITERSFSKITGRAGRRSLLLGRTLSLERVNDLPKVTQHVWYNRDRDPDFLWNLPGAQTSWFLHPPELASWALGKSRGSSGPALLAPTPGRPWAGPPPYPGPGSSLRAYDLQGSFPRPVPGCVPRVSAAHRRRQRRPRLTPAG